eukprot:CAMPEP_0185206894 /NCGR_PEP_ID=MMETSP1140-20130426/59264_1 /TAXON_ID=298111 /ORGANISM="Pavlova sp., Strain CCMP459" /LENGTH=97 /DNA_ID=CAMNT_0027774559 /DNA_START=79 /DNA_END=370 /DNA_ORIENTATION=+
MRHALAHPRPLSQHPPATTSITRAGPTSFGVWPVVHVPIEPSTTRTPQSALLRRRLCLERAPACSVKRGDHAPDEEPAAIPIRRWYQTLHQTLALAG